MNNVLIRTLTGAVFITLILLPLFFDAIYFLPVVTLFALLGIIEYSKLFQKSSNVSLNWQLNSFISFLIFGIIAAIQYNFIPTIVLISILPLLFLWMLTELWRKKEQPLYNLGVGFFGILYVVVPFLLLLEINLQDTHAFPILSGMFILIWTNDTFAYLSGRFFGKRKLFERISPKKTWEGTIGGVLFTFAMAIALSFLFDTNNLCFWLISAAVIAPCAVLGDLLESLFKRSLNIKDSGTLLPGHGGILDRFDATLFAIPFFYLWLTIYPYF